jgi:NMD protein affecting ribosome stability and mRNA decay
MEGKSIKCPKCGTVTEKFIVVVYLGAICQDCHRKLHDLVNKKVGKIY